MPESAPIEVGDIVILTAGQWSDYGIQAVAKAAKRIDAEVWARMTAECSVVRDPYKRGLPPYFDHELALPWLLRNGYLEEVSFREQALDFPWGE